MNASVGHILRSLSAILVCLLFAAGAAFGQESAGQADRTIQSLRDDLQRVLSEIQLPTVTDQQLTEDRRMLEATRTKALLEAEKLVAPLNNLDQQITRLGAAPTDASTEPQPIAEQRAVLDASQKRLKAAKAQLEVIAVEAEQASGRAASIQRDQFFSRIFERSKSILNPSLWYDTGVGIIQLGQRLGSLFSTWWKEVQGTADFAELLVIPLIFAAFSILFMVLRQRMSRWLDAGVLASRSPDEIDRLWRVVRGILSMGLLLIAVLLVIDLGLNVSGLSTPRLTLFVSAVSGVISSTVLNSVLAHRLTAPGLPAWRIVALNEPSAVRFPLLFSLAAFVAALTDELQKLTDSLFLPLANTIGQSAVSAAAMVVLIALILLIFGSQDETEEPPVERKSYFRWSSQFAPFAWVLLGVATVALLLGYIALANYIVQQMFDTAVLITVLFLVHHLADAAVASSVDPSSAFGRFLRRVGGFTDRGISRLGLLVRIVVDLLLVVIGLPLLFLQWTVTWVDFRSIINTAFFGFKIGDVSVSLWSVLLLVLIIASGIVLTNLVIRWLDARVLTGSSLDKGVQDSVRKGGSYAGYLLAGIFALSAAGLDFTNLALVAGALGVGIGLGLQSIVSNFVSGLILLAERPIRAGDWITIAAGEGIVKRINVRSTLIETFDKSAVIVPNSLLIAEPVRNWTYGDGAGRFAILVTTGYDQDPEKICELLLGIANAHRAVMSDPPANAILFGFVDLGMRFELKGFVADVFEGVFVASEIRIAIHKAFKEKGIQFPVVNLEREIKRPKQS